MTFVNADHGKNKWHIICDNAVIKLNVPTVSTEFKCPRYVKQEWMNLMQTWTGVSSPPPSPR